MGVFDDLGKKAQDLMGDEKVQDALRSEQAEDISDNVLDGVSGFANNVTGDKFDEQISGARDAADKHIGNE